MPKAPAKRMLRPDRRSISVSGSTYDRLRAAYPFGGLSAFVEEVVTAGLDDLAISKRVLKKCREAERIS
jgi:hypothetical protein